ncbi:G-rich sequence factor 1 [Solea senegalensis]|uniref:G-rich sequence factor 1 n=1 Tax=Solea senegalensis TaxID=28829 RepID=A0AAV6QFQ6_SOLSE|nr:G-rich sequence factor 1 [Solea senegalensis]KAG7489096.1 G-rich sequence factor 1 [Solea senegalensis]
MSRASQSMMFLLRRCVAVQKVPLPRRVTTRGGFIQQRTWTPATQTGYVQRLCQVRSAVENSQFSFCTKTGPPHEDVYPPLPTYQSDAALEKKELYIVQVKGLPWSCTAQDLMQFFSESRIRDGLKGIHLTVDRQGRPSGRAFIEMEHEEDVNKALEKHRQYLGPRYVEVYEVSNSDAEAILTKALQAPTNGCVVRLRGLPFNCTEADIVQFFTGLDIKENGINVITDRRGRKTGEAFVQFNSQEAADEALQRDREVIGNRYIEVFPSRSDEIYTSEKTKMENDAASPITRPPRSSAAAIHCVHMRGLPFRASGVDIVKFFSPLVVSKILMECGYDGRPSGEADVYFTSYEDAVAAMSRDKQYIGGRYIELFLNSLSDSEES